MLIAISEFIRLPLNFFFFKNENEWKPMGKSYVRIRFQVSDFYVGKSKFRNRPQPGPSFTNEVAVYLLFGHWANIFLNLLSIINST